MPVRSFEDHIQTLIGRSVTESKVAGTSSSDIEARSVLESIALTLLLKPKAVLFLAHLARNGLLAAVNAEIAAIALLNKTIDDLGNATFTATDATELNKAHTSLIQMESLDKIDSSEGAFKRFDSSINSFLNDSLAKTVRTKGSTELTRPDTEAAADLPNDFSALTTAHTAMLGRLYAFAVGVENFESSPLGTVLGLATAFRARTDLEDIISLVENGESGTQARDLAVRLLGSRAALKTVGTLPVLDAPLIDTQNNLPAGYVLQAESDPATATTLSSVAPFTFGAAAAATITVNGQVLTATNFPQAGLDLANRAFLTSGPGIVYPLTVPSGTRFFLRFVRLTASAGYDLQPDGTYLKQVLVPITLGSRTLAQVLVDINAAITTDGTAVEYLAAGTGRIIIVGNASIVNLSMEQSMTATSSSTVGGLSFYTDSSASLFGFLLVQAVSGTTPIGIVVDSLNFRFPTITAAQTPSQQVSVTTILDVPGTSLTIASDSGLGLNGVFKAQSDLLRIFGTVNGVPTDPVDPSPLVDVSDDITVPSGGTTIIGLTPTRMHLAAPVDTFTGDIEVISSLGIAYSRFNSNVQAFVETWLETPFAQDLATIDRAVAVLNGSATPAARNAAKTVLQQLNVILGYLVTALQSGPLPPEAATDEKTLVDGIIGTLTERKYDKALDYVLQIKLQEFFELTGDTASYGGSLLKTMSDVAQSDITFPNTVQEEGIVKGVVKGFST